MIGKEYMQLFELIDIVWKKFNGEKNKEIIGNKEYKNVIYQAYGNSPIYGRDVLLYIGISNDFIRRKNEHIDFEKIENLSFRIGSIEFLNREKRRILEICESIIITMMKPSYNSRNIKDINKNAKSKKYIVFNKEEKGDLPLEISNIWWFDKYY
jgi:hypothetical protein